MFKLPDLPYPYDALEPHIDARTMEIHHTKHHQTYVNKLNEALEGRDDLLNMDVADLMMNLDKVPQEKMTVVRNNGGGHANHSFFWILMSPEGSGEPSGALAEAINGTFGSFGDFQAKFKEAALGVFGSGWAWLCQDQGDLHIEVTPRQDSPLMNGHRPVLGLDVWEHAYYLKYQSRRAEYIDAWWNVVNWDQVRRNWDNKS